MPETRLAKARETLPAGYQFGDGRIWATMIMYNRAALQSLADRIDDHIVAHVYREAYAGWNTIEPE